MEATILTHDAVRTYYGEVLSDQTDLKTTTCCSTETLPSYLKAILSGIEDEVMMKFYGCGAPIPLGLEGTTVLDLGCGTGRDVFVASKLVGSDGFVIGLDMTDEQLEVAHRHEAAQMTRFGFGQSNVAFKKGYIEDLGSAGIADDSVDVVISNCVINLVPDKERVFQEIYRVLKSGGELYFSDVFADRRLPDAVRHDPVLLGECLGGALYTEDFRRVMSRVGFADFRIASQSPIEVEDPVLVERVGNATFTSQTIRAFKLPDLLEDRCEDYGQVAYYNGTLPHAPHRFVLDDHHVFETGRPMLVCGNTAAMVANTRFGAHFRVIGDRSVHFGLFDCAPAAADGGDAVGCGC
ncbi:MAG: methyltransferase domain-containing protein [Rhodothermales bacterium]